MKSKTEVHGDVVGSAIGEGATVIARDINVYKEYISRSHLDVALKVKLLQARAEVDALQLPQGDKEDVTDELGKLTEEVEKEVPDANRIRRLWRHIEEVAPTVAAVLQSAASLATILAGG